MATPRTVAATAAPGPALRAGWHIVTGVARLGRGRPLWPVLVSAHGSGPRVRHPATPVLEDGRWQTVLVLPAECTGWWVETEDGAPVAALASLEARPLGKLETATRMLSSPTAPGKRLGALRLLAGLGATARGLLRGGPRAAADALAAHYLGTLVRAREPAPLPSCRVRRHAWPALAGDRRMAPGPDLHPMPEPGGECVWRAGSDDPQFHVAFDRGGALPSGWYRFSAQVQAIDGDIAHPCLYPDYGSGMEHETMIPLPLPDHDGNLSAVVLLRHAVTTLRFDPSMRQTNFRLGRVALHRLTRFSAAARMLAAFRVAGGRALLAVAREALSALTRAGPSAAGDLLHRRYRELLSPDQSDYASWVKMYDTFTPASLRQLAHRAERLHEAPLVSILLPVYQTPERWLRRCIESVVAQAYTNWELCIADDASPSERVRQVLGEYAARDPRIRVQVRPVNGHISEASNTCLEMARGQYIGLLDHDDELRPHALLEVFEALQGQPHCRMVYSDEDKIDEAGRRFEPNFKPAWNPDLLLSQNYVCHFTVLETRLAREAGGFRKGFEGSQDHDLVLRCSEFLQPSQVLHVPRVLYHWRAIEGSTALRRDAKDYASDAGARAVADHLERTGAGAVVEQLPHGHYRVRWPLPSPPPLVSLVIPTRDKVHLLRTCVESILRITAYPALELLVVDNQSSDPETLDYLEGLRGESRVRVLPYDAEFNYSAINNFAVEQAAGSIIGLVNNDIEVRSTDWLDELVGQVLRPGIGAVGTMLYYPDGSIQHAGVLLGVGGIANHAYAHQPHGYPGHCARGLVAQNLSAVTGACLFVKRGHYLELGGLDESLAVAFNDIDFCLRLRDRGYRNLWTPFTHIIHHESASRGVDDTAAKRARFEFEVAFMRRRWGEALYADPAYNPNLSLDSVNFEMAFPPRTPASSTAGSRERPARHRPLDHTLDCT